jgi:AcrR family transcriptional regulator
MNQNTVILNKAKRKKAILAAALKCFLQFGYTKTSMDDVAKEANLSRPLIYLKFKNKEDLYVGVIEYLSEGRFEEADKILASSKSKKQKLTSIYKIFLIEPWEQIIGKPMSADFYIVYKTLFQEVAEKYKRQTLRATEQVLEDKMISETFMLAVEGLKSDLPEVRILKNRLKILIDQFISSS